MDKKDFNIFITGVGGQGILTLTRILAQAALTEKMEVKTSELHGLSQRGGSVETHIRFGKDIFSPLIKKFGADLIISLEIQESLRACYFASREKTTFLIDNILKPIIGNNKIYSQKMIAQELKSFSKKAVFLPASQIAKENFGNEILAGIFLLGYACQNKIIPFKKESFLKAIDFVIPQKYLELNKKAFNSGFSGALG